ncbi:CPBP family glutamic-type intramembrane protease [Crossiella sp. SN42]|uniref:CPBP family glutamic-type intramembrane protease n=1 Tax=Crossiella sp. SN42 TaxID=2944808 RepID=UPI00207D20FB|nr:CPBP family glutamic-type intramembrane protease [Crossiella sp. SN42]MCO1574610.1 CPBP family glutamic-type intramembrane protease [Crossiella sp. SN42]
MHPAAVGLLAVLVAAHLALPWCLGLLARGRAAGLTLAVRRAPVRVYGLATTALGAAAAVVLTAARAWPPAAHPVAAAGAGLVVGAGLPLLASALARRRSGAAGRRWRPRLSGLPLQAAAAVAEELLWRAAAVLALTAAGLPWLVAAALSVAGFTVLHLPRHGRRGLPYLLVLALVLTALAESAGLLAAAAAHVAHNAVLAARPPPEAAPAPATVPELPPSRDW